MVEPKDALAPVIPPVTDRTVHAKVLGVLEFNTILGEEPLQIEAVGGFVTIGVGLTVTVIVYTGPVHKPELEDGMTKYATVPAVELLGLVSV